VFVEGEDDDATDDPCRGDRAGLEKVLVDLLAEGEPDDGGGDGGGDQAEQQLATSPPLSSMIEPPSGWALDGDNDRHE
jgi:hypothetical protein